MILFTESSDDIENMTDEEEEDVDIDDYDDEEIEENEDTNNVNVIVRKRDDDSEDESDGNNLFDGQSHKESLQKLRKTDPEFYKFLEENDRKLLDFNASDSEDDDEEELCH